MALQNALINAGIAVSGGADGVFGAGTASAVMAFQRAKGLTGVRQGRRGHGRRPRVWPRRRRRRRCRRSTCQLEAKPVQGPCYYGDTWSAARGNGRIHLGVDIVAAEGNQLYAVATGRVSQIYTDAAGSLSGNGLKIARPDGTYFFYAHLSSLAPGIAVGTPVTAGQLDRLRRAHRQRRRPAPPPRGPSGRRLGGQPVSDRQGAGSLLRLAAALTLGAPS